MGCRSSRAAKWSKEDNVTFTECEDTYITHPSYNHGDFEASVSPICQSTNAHQNFLWSFDFLMKTLCIYLVDEVQILLVVNRHFYEHVIRNRDMIKRLQSVLATTKPLNKIWNCDRLVRLLVTFVDPESLRVLSVVSRVFYDQIMLETIVSFQPNSPPRTSIDGRNLSNDGCGWLEIPSECYTTAWTMTALMDLRQVAPNTDRLCLAKMISQNCVPVAACFVSLQHVCIGGMRSSHSSSIVCDRDIVYLVRTLGHNLKSLRLLKLSGITHITLSSIARHCTALSSLVLFGCSRVRQSVRQQELENGSQSIPNFFPLPLTDDDPSGDTIACSRAIAVLDVRYSLDLSDSLLTQISLRFNPIQIFLGSNLASSDSSASLIRTAPQRVRQSVGLVSTAFQLFPLSVQHSPAPLLRISQTGWTSFVSCNLDPLATTTIDSDDVLLYVDDLQREEEECAGSVCSSREISARGGDVHWLVCCPRYQTHHPVTLSLAAAAGSNCVVQSMADRRTRDSMLSCDVNQTDSFSLESVLLSLPVPLQTNACPLFRRHIH